MSIDSLIVRRVAQEGRKKIIFLISLVVAGVIGGLVYGIALRSARIETRIFLGNSPASKDPLNAHSMEVLVRSSIIPEELANAHLPISERTIQVVLADATIILTSGIAPNNYDSFRAIHERIAEKTRAKAALDLSIQREAINAKIKMLEQSVGAREATIGKVDRLSEQIAAADSKLESSGNDVASVARRCNMIEVTRKTGDKPEIVCDPSTLIAEQKILSAGTSLKVTIAGQDNRLKLEEQEADLKFNRLISNSLFVEPTVLFVARITSISAHAFGLLTAMLGAVLGLILGLATLAAWVVVKDLSFESERQEINRKA